MGAKESKARALGEYRGWEHCGGGAAKRGRSCECRASSWMVRVHEWGRTTVLPPPCNDGESVGQANEARRGDDGNDHVGAKVVAESKACAYWANPEDGSTTWEEPLSEGAVARVELLEGWYECTSADGRPYYHHPGTMENRWDKPWEQPTGAPVAAAEAAETASSPAAAAEESAPAAPAAKTDAAPPAAASEAPAVVEPAAVVAAVESESAPAATPAAHHIAEAESEEPCVEPEVDLAPKGGGCCIVA